MKKKSNMHTNINNVENQVPQVVCAKTAQIQIAQMTLVLIFNNMKMSFSV